MLRMTISPYTRENTDGTNEKGLLVVVPLSNVPDPMRKRGITVIAQQSSFTLRMIPCKPTNELEDNEQLRI